MNIRRLYTVVLTVLVLSVIVFISPTPAYASGHWECDYYGNNGCVWVEDPAPYYEELTYEHDWCLYGVGDRVWIHYHVSGVYLIADAWYVIPSWDYTSNGPTSAGWSGDTYVGSNCTLFTVP
jgi:hypothetical protein